MTMDQRRTTIVRTLLVVGIIVAVNIIAMSFFTRMDLTSGKIYTLSPTSRQLAKSLDDRFVVKAYFNGEVPPPYNNNRRYLQDQLDEYRAYARGNFQYEFIDPSKNQELEQEAQRYGIPPVQIQVVKEDKLQIEKAYMGLVFLYGDKQERLPVIQNTDNLEYEISSTIKKLTSKQLKKVGMLSGHGEPSLQQMSRLQEMLAKQYEVTTVELTGGKEIPPDVAALLIVAPTQPLKSWEKYLIDQYLMKGGKIAFFINQINASLQSQQGRPQETGMNDLLQSYGVRINTDLVRDVNCAYVTVSEPMGFMVMQTQIPHYFLPRASRFDATSPIVKDLSGVVFHFVSSIDTSLAHKQGTTANVLVKSSERSGRQEQFFMLDPRMQVTKEMFKDNGIPLVVSLEGQFPSAFAETNPESDTSLTAPLDTGHKLTKGVSSRIVVAGDGDFVLDQLSGGNTDNFLLATNLVDWLADDIGLASIRSRQSGVKPLKEVDEGTRTLVKGINLAVPPLLVVLVGVVRWRWRASMRKRLEAQGV
jgi:gliding-associated putative ABC transporter substrate-binding component GldG